MENGNEDVAIGKIIDEESYQRDDKHINIDNIVNIDFIRSEGILHEVKKSPKIEEASIMQVKYYLYYLKQRGVTGIKGKIDYPLLKQSIMVELLPCDEINIVEICKDIKLIANLLIPPELEKKPICRKCAYYELCYI